MSIYIREPALEKQVETVGKERGHKTLSKTLSALAHERLLELQTGRFLPPPPSVFRRRKRRN
jgi:hypothetical protein